MYSYSKILTNKNKNTNLKTSTFKINNYKRFK